MLGFLDHPYHELVVRYPGSGGAIKEIGHVIGHDHRHAARGVREDGADAVDRLPRGHEIIDT